MVLILKIWSKLATVRCRVYFDTIHFYLKVLLIEPLNTNYAEKSTASVQYSIWAVIAVTAKKIFLHNLR